MDIAIYLHFFCLLCSLSYQNGFIVTKRRFSLQKLQLGSTDSTLSSWTRFVPPASQDIIEDAAKDMLRDICYQNLILPSYISPTPVTSTYVKYLAKGLSAIPY